MQYNGKENFNYKEHVNSSKKDTTRPSIISLPTPLATASTGLTVIIKTCIVSFTKFHHLVGVICSDN